MRFSLHRFVAVSASVAWFASAASATVIFNQNFDNTVDFPTGVGISATGDGTTSDGRWARNDSTSPTPTPLADPAPAYSGDQAVRVTRNGPGYTGLLGYRSDSSAITGGTFTFQFSVYRNTSDSSFTVNVNSDTTTANNNAPLGLYIDQFGDVYTTYSGGSGYGPRGLNIPQSTWTQFRQVVDMTTGKYDLYATVGAGSETQILDDYAYNTVDISSAAAVAFMPANPTGNTFFVDDVFLGDEAVPEPMSGGILLGSGMLLLPMRRRRKAK